MVELQFVGDVSEFSDAQKELIVNVFKERGFENDKIEVQPVGKAGDNYVARVKRIIAEKNGETFKVIAKIAPNKDMMRTMGNTPLLFQNEHVIYTEVLPKFTELEKAANIPEEERLRYAACYGTYLEAPNEIILLEDLDVPGFKMLDRFTSLTDENVRLVLKSFASFHSLAYVLKYQEPETFETFNKSLVNLWLLMTNTPEMTIWLTQFGGDIQKILHGDKYKKAVGTALRAAQSVKKYDPSKYFAIQQGDAWTNNIMFKIENDKSVECCMIDYQGSTVGSPVADLHYMIFICTDYVTRKKHYNDWMDYYHSQLDKNLNYFGLKVNYVYPRDQLDADLRRFAKSSLCQIMMTASITVRETENAAKLQDAMKNSDKSIEDMVDDFKITDSDTKKKFQKKMEGVIDSFFELGYL